MPPAAARAAAPPPAVHALLLNGGGGPGSNYLSHFHHLEDMAAVLRGRGIPSDRIHVFNADGEDPAPDLTRRDLTPAGFALLEGTKLGASLAPPPALVDSKWPGVALRPARHAALGEWFEGPGRRLRAGDTLILFVTDHGTADAGDPDLNAISLWQESLTVRDLAGLITRLPAGVRVATVMSQCYSGAFARLTEILGPGRDVCGFFSATADRMAYGCYPEGRDRDRVGHAFHFIDALARNETADAAHREVLAFDATPDAPLRTSDALLARFVAEEAAFRDADRDGVTDALLAQAPAAPAEWRAETALLDRVAAAYGLGSPRRVRDVAALEAELAALAKRADAYGDRWRILSADVRESLIASFVRAHPAWEARLAPEAVAALEADARAGLLGELLPRLEEHARRTRQATRLARVRAHAERLDGAEWRIEVRRGALLRLRTLLVAIAGRRLARGENAAAVARLDACEAFSPGPLPAAPRPPAGASPTPAFPPLARDAALLEDLAPSWLGVRYRPVSPAMRAERRLAEGATAVEAVLPGSPAEEAGLQAGDVLLGPPGRPFEASWELREWTMTGPRGAPRRLSVLRPGVTAESDRRLEVEAVLARLPVEVP